MRIVFFGTPALGAGILDYLIKSDNQVAAVVTQPDRARGRSKELVASPVKQLALANGIPVLQPEKVSEPAFIAELKGLKADAFTVAAYAQKLPGEILEMTQYGCINVHPSLLPKYRGATPLVAAILSGDKETGVSIMKMAEKMDTGDIYLQKTIELDPKETPETLEPKVVKLGGEMLLDCIEQLENGVAVATPQPEEGASYMKQLIKADGLIDFSQDAASIERMTRAYDPWPGAYTYLEGKIFKIVKAEVVTELGKGGAKPGQVVYNDGKVLAVKCGEDCLSLISVQLEGKKEMDIQDFLRGKNIQVGTRLGQQE